MKIKAFVFTEAFLNMEQQELIPNLFKTEFRKITAVLCKLFGVDHIQIAEDIAGETFLSAVETWSYNGIPPNPTAWLYTVAKNKAKNYFKHHAVFTQKIAAQLKQTSLTVEEIDIDLSDQNISDSQLQMLFAICHPSISTEAQIGLSLRILCGFGIDEIANAFLTSKETINKRLFRAKEKLRQENVLIEPLDFSNSDNEEINKRLETVLTTLYLLFSEGYYSESQATILREELCFEAMRLTSLLMDNEETDQPGVAALLSLMYFHASRFAARKRSNGESVLYHEQDEKLWNQEFIAKGIHLLNKAAKGNRMSKYHIEASIAYWHTIKAESSEKWESVLQLYNQLLQIEYSPIAALNRTYALSKANGKKEAIIEAEKLNLLHNHFYFALLGELYKELDNEKSLDHFKKAFSLAKSPADKQTLQRKIDNC